MDEAGSTIAVLRLHLGHKSALVRSYMHKGIHDEFYHDIRQIGHLQRQDYSSVADSGWDELDTTGSLQIRLMQFTSCLGVLVSPKSYTCAVRQK